MNYWDAVDLKMRDIAGEVKEKGKVKASEIVWDYGIALTTLKKKAGEYGLEVRKEKYMRGLYESFRYMVVCLGEEEEG